MLYIEILPVYITKILIQYFNTIFQHYILTLYFNTIFQHYYIKLNLRYDQNKENTGSVTPVTMRMESPGATIEDTDTNQLKWGKLKGEKTLQQVIKATYLEITKWKKNLFTLPRRKQVFSLSMR